MKKIAILAFLAMTLFAVSSAEAQVQMVASTSTKAIGAVAAGTASADTLLGALNAETKAYPIGNASDVGLRRCRQRLLRRRIVLHRSDPDGAHVVRPVV